MMILYDLPISSYGCKTRILLRHKNLQWQSVAPPDGYGVRPIVKLFPPAQYRHLMTMDLNYVTQKPLQNISTRLRQHRPCYPLTLKTVPQPDHYHGFTTAGSSLCCARISVRWHPPTVMQVSFKTMPICYKPDLTSWPKWSPQRRFYVAKPSVLPIAVLCQVSPS